MEALLRKLVDHPDVTLWRGSSATVGILYRVADGLVWQKFQGAGGGGNVFRIDDVDGVTWLGEEWEVVEERDAQEKG